MMDWPKVISDKLNAAWDPAWNVALTVTIADLITNTTGDFRNVVYGYAYNQHWLWYNKFKVMQHPTNPSSYFYFSFIIWKDYNCHSWVTQRYSDRFNTTTKATAIQTAIKDISTK
jgi:hypothetical protein